MGSRTQQGGIEQHRGRFRATWQVGGRRHRRSFATEAHARAFLSRLRREHRSAHRRIAGGLTVMDVVSNWYEGHKGALESGTRRDYEGRIRRNVSRIGDTLAQEVARNPRLLRAFYANLTPTNARRVHAILRQAFEDALLHEEVTRNPCEVVRPRKPRPPERPIPSPAEVEKMIGAAEEQDPLWGLFVNVTTTLGTRRGETCVLRWEDVDPVARRVHIRRAVCKGVNGPTELKLPKNGRERSLLVGEAFFEEVEPLRRQGWLFAGRATDRPWHPDWPGHRFQRLMYALDLPYTLHALRHFVATQLLARGLPVNQVAHFMGHRDPSVTMNLYGNHIVDDVQRAMGDAAASLFRRD